jgi:hypothetical protein
MRIRALASESSGTVLSTDSDGAESAHVDGARVLTVTHVPGKDEVSA